MRNHSVWLMALALLGGCAAQPMPDSFGIPESIEYRTVGEPIDVSDALPPALTLSDVVAEAVRHDPSLQAALARLRSAMADARQSRLLPNPVLSVVARFPEGGGSPTIEAGLTAELLALLARPRQISAADHRLRAAGSDVLMVALDVIAQAQDQFVTVQSIDAELTGLQRQQELLNRMLVVARARLEIGESSRLDVMTLDAQRIRTESEALDSQARRRDERLALSRMLGRPSGAADWTITPWSPPANLELAETESIELALKHRPEIQARRWELAALGDETALAHWSLLDGAEVGVDSERDDGTWSIGPSVALPLPIFDWGQARQDKTAAAQVEARHELVRSKRQVVEDVRRAAAAVTLSQESLAKVRGELIPLLQRRHEQARSAYQVGELDITAVLLADQELQSARSRQIELELRVATSHVKMNRAIGHPIDISENGRNP